MFLACPALPWPGLLANHRKMQCADQGDGGPERHPVWTFHVSCSTSACPVLEVLSLLGVGCVYVERLTSLFDWLPSFRWDSYTAMTRIYKHYQFNLQQVRTISRVVG
jgi:hypothetical protein